MSRWFVNLPIGYIHRDPGYLELFESRGLSPELGLDAAAVDGLPRSFHKDLARRLDAAGLARSIHLPFQDVHPGSPDPLILEAARERLARALEIAALYEPRVMVAHSGVPVDQTPEPLRYWLNTCRETWTRLLDAWKDHPVLALENTFDRSPDPLCDLLDALDRERIGFLFDVGHWYGFSGGSKRDDLRDWLRRIGGRLAHLHLHDNAGETDEHLGLGQGSIPFDQLFAHLAARDLRPTVTFEPHSREAFAQTLAFAAAHPHWFGRLGIPVGRLAEMAPFRD